MLKMSEIDLAIQNIKESLKDIVLYNNSNNHYNTSFYST